MLLFRHLLCSTCTCVWVCWCVSAFVFMCCDNSLLYFCLRIINLMLILQSREPSMSINESMIRASIAFAYKIFKSIDTHTRTHTLNNFVEFFCRKIDEFSAKCHRIIVDIPHDLLIHSAVHLLSIALFIHSIVVLCN